MATSPDYVRLATSATRALADTALDSLRDAVVVVDTRHKHFPVVLANAAARRCLTADLNPLALIEAPLHRWLAHEPAMTVETMAALSDPRQPSRQILAWRFVGGEISVETDIKPLSSAPGQRLVMLTFSPDTPEPRLQVANEYRMRGGSRSLSGDISVDGEASFDREAGVDRERDSLFEDVSLENTAHEITARQNAAHDSTAGANSAHHTAHHTAQNSTNGANSAHHTARDSTADANIAHHNAAPDHARDDAREWKTEVVPLAQREEVFRLAADAVDGVIYEWDVPSGFVHRSRGVLEVLGLEPEGLEPTLTAWMERIHPRDFDAAKKTIDSGLLNGRGWTTTYRIRDQRGRYISMLERGLVQRNTAGGPARVIGCCVDVSEMRRVNDLLAETQRAAQMGGWEYSYATRELTWTDEMYRIYNTRPGEFPVSWEAMLAQCTPESLRRLHEAFGCAEAAGGALDLELEIMTLEKERLWVRLIGHVELLDGRPFRAYGSVQNVQAQKLAQIALQTSTGWLKLSMNMAHMHAWRWDRTQDMLEFAIVDGQKVNLPSVFPGMKKFMARVHPADRAAVSHAIDGALLHQREIQKEFRLKSPRGRYRWYAAIARPRFDGSTVPRGLVGVIQDITARRESDLRLQRSEELLRVTTANAADTLMLVDTDLRVRFINKSVGAMSIEQIIGRELGELLPEAARGTVLERLRQVLDTGETATYEFQSAPEEPSSTEPTLNVAAPNGATPIRSTRTGGSASTAGPTPSAGEVRYFENRAVLVRDAGIGTGISIATRDITERKRLEQEILEISGRERHSIGRDLHDGLGQELTGVALMLRGLAGRVQGRCPDVIDSVNEIIGLVNRSIENARSLARGLLPVRTETGGLAFALRELASRSRDLYGLEVNFRAEVWHELTLDETAASHLYRIAQEALTNSARHGHATVVDIFLQARRNNFLLCITDNGEGFSLPTSPYSGMGLKIMKYRAGMIGAKFELAANPPHGTVVRVMGEQPLISADVTSGRVTEGVRLS